MEGVTRFDPICQRGIRPPLPLYSAPGCPLRRGPAVRPTTASWCYLVGSPAVTSQPRHLRRLSRRRYRRATGTDAARWMSPTMA